MRDYAQVRHEGNITGEIALEALRLFEVDDEGLDRVDREILNLILHKFDGGPVGLSTLAVAIGEEADTIEDVYEPFLLQRGFLMRTPRGRVLTRLGLRALRRHASGGGPSSRGPAPCSGESGRGRVTSMKLLLHTCCGPCASATIPCLDRPRGGSDRLLLQPEHPSSARVAAPAHGGPGCGRSRPAWRCVEDPAYDPEAWFAASVDARARGPRCGRCIGQRLERAAQEAAARGC